VPADTWKDVIQTLGWAVGGLTIIGLGLNYLIARANCQERGIMTVPEIEKHRRPVRILHWVHAGAFIILFLTGLVLFMPALAFLAEDRWTHLIHRIAAVIFVVIPVLYLIINPAAAGRGLKQAFTWGAADLGWLKAAPRYYLFGDEKAMPPQDSMNSGQKMWWFITVVFGFLFVITGLVMWFWKTEAPASVLRWMVFVHDVAFIVTGAMLFLHIYLAVFHPVMTEAWKSMASGKISVEYAKMHHGKWYEEVTKGQEEKAK
jgi:formate dehydrogenase subunit gamma